MALTTSATTDVIADGITAFALDPGGRFGPDRVVIDNKEPGGGIWGGGWTLGPGLERGPESLLVAEVRMPPNQYWPPHWHADWIAVLVWDGTILFGDHWLSRGDVLISPAMAEYGPLLNGPEGCQIFEIFSRGPTDATYALDYHDHPTLEFVQSRKTGRPTDFGERPPGSIGKPGNQITPLLDIPGLVLGRFDGTGRWDLGESSNPDRGVVVERKLGPSESLALAPYSDWHSYLVFEGDGDVGGRKIVRDDVLMGEPGATFPTLTAGPEGLHLIEFARSASSLDRA